MTRAERLTRVLDWIKRNRVHEGFIHDDKYHIDGVCVGGLTVVNPQPGVVEALLHEALHRVSPRASDEWVTREAFEMLAHMRDDEVRRLYRQYQRRKRALKKTVDLSD